MAVIFCGQSGALIAENGQSPNMFSSAPYIIVEKPKSMIVTNDNNTMKVVIFLSKDDGIVD